MAMWGRMNGQKDEEEMGKTTDRERQEQGGDVGE